MLCMFGLYVDIFLLLLVLVMSMIIGSVNCAYFLGVSFLMYLSVLIVLFCMM